MTQQPPPAAPSRLVDLSHAISEHMVTSPGLPGPTITSRLTREASRAVYAPGTEFTIDQISMVGNTGTYLDSPFHRYPDGADLAGLSLDCLANLPAIVVRAAGAVQSSGAPKRAVDVEELADLDVRGCAVLLHTGGDATWGTERYAVDAPYLSEMAATWLVEQGAALVGSDAVNIDRCDAAAAGARPVNSILLAAGIPVVEHLTGLGGLPALGARFSAVPPRVSGFGTFPVRAWAVLPA